VGAALRVLRKIVNPLPWRVGMGWCRKQRMTMRISKGAIRQGGRLGVESRQREEPEESEEYYASQCPRT
jgi:hypothetical protein